MKAINPARLRYLFDRKVLLWLLFSAPVFAVSVRHWISGLYVVISFLSIFLVCRSSKRIVFTFNEKLLFLGFLGYFSAFAAAAVANDWDDGSLRMLERELRYLLAIPIYLYFRERQNAIIYLGFGAALGIAVNTVVILYQMLGLGFGRDLGTYGPLFTGPVTVLMLIVASRSIEEAIEARKATGLVLLLTLFTAITAALTSRSALLGLLVWIFFYVTVLKKEPVVKILTVLLLCVVVFAPGSQTFTSHRSGFDLAYQEARDYFIYFYENPNRANLYATSSVGTRLEMLRAVPLVLKESPLLGVGSYNYNQAVKKYVDAGELASSVSMHGHPHNVFAEVLISKGLLGFGFFLLILAAMYKIALERGGDLRRNWYALAFLSTLLTMMLTESAIATKGNFISVFLLFAAVLLTHRKASGRSASQLFK